MNQNKSTSLKAQKQIIKNLLREMLISNKLLKRNFRNNVIQENSFNVYVNENFSNEMIETLMSGDGLDNQKLVFFFEETIKENQFQSDASILEYSNEEDIMLLYRKKSLSNKVLYFIELNGQVVYSSKTYNPFKNKMTKLIERYGLNLSE